MSFHETRNDSFQWCRRSHCLSSIRRHLCSFKDKIKNLGRWAYTLGIHIQYHKGDRVISVSQPQKIDQIVKDFSFYKGTFIFKPHIIYKKAKAFLAIVIFIDLLLEVLWTLLPGPGRTWPMQFLYYPSISRNLVGATGLWPRLSSTSWRQLEILFLFWGRSTDGLWELHRFFKTQEKRAPLFHLCWLSDFVCSIVGTLR